MTSAALLRGASVLQPNGTITPAEVLIDNDGRIAAIAERIEAGKTEVIDVVGATLVPGFIDLHVHGGGGSSLVSTRPREIQSYARWVASHGVTGFLATICADTLDAGIAAATVASRIGPVDDGAAVLGLNFEGPFVSPERPGALPASWLQTPSVETLTRLIEAAGGTARVITVAPELEGADEVIAAALEAGLIVSVGHTDATYAVALKAFAAGASHVTHTFNAMRPLHHRDPGTIGAALESPGVTIEVIADGVHLHSAAVDLLVRAFGEDRVCLITDAVTPAGLDSGVFKIGGQEAKLTREGIRLPDGTIAGSATTMDAVVRNVVTWGVAGLGEAVRMASTTPARVLGLEARKGSISVGFDADIVALSAEMTVVKTWAAGRLVHSR